MPILRIQWTRWPRDTINGPLIKPEWELPDYLVRSDRTSSVVSNVRNTLSSRAVQSCVTNVWPPLLVIAVCFTQFVLSRPREINDLRISQEINTKSRDRQHTHGHKRIHKDRQTDWWIDRQIDIHDRQMDEQDYHEHYETIPTMPSSHHLYQYRPDLAGVEAGRVTWSENPLRPPPRTDLTGRNQDRT